MPAIVVGEFREDHAQAIGAALLRGGREAVFFRSTEEARDELSRAEVATPALLVVGRDENNVDGFIEWMRGEAALFGVPVLVTVPNPSDHAFVEAHALGADDVTVSGDLGALTKRCAAISNYDSNARPQVTRGRVVIAHPALSKRRILGRLLRLAGYDPAFASNVDEVVQVCSQSPEPSILVASEHLTPPNALEAVARVRERSGKSLLPCVLLADETRVPILRQAASSMNRVLLASENAPPDNLLFYANELLTLDVKNLRASARLIFSAMCAFRPAGELSPNYGLTYNVSREGFYVRTLDPPKAGTQIWFEFRPYNAREAVHLRGTVVWNRTVQSGLVGAVPPGFGIRVTESHCPAQDLAHYVESYENLLNDNA